MDRSQHFPFLQLHQLLWVRISFSHDSHRPDGPKFSENYIKLRRANVNDGMAALLLSSTLHNHVRDRAWEHIPQLFSASCAWKIFAKRQSFLSYSGFLNCLSHSCWFYAPWDNIRGKVLNARHFLKGMKSLISFIIDNFTIYPCKTLRKKIPIGFYHVCWGNTFKNSQNLSPQTGTGRWGMRLIMHTGLWIPPIHRGAPDSSSSPCRRNQGSLTLLPFLKPSLMRSDLLTLVPPKGNADTEGASVCGGLSPAFPRLLSSPWEWG